MRLGSLNWLGLLWSLSRLTWGTVALTSVVNGWLTQAEKSKEYYTAFLIVLFLATEVVPILFSLQKTVIQRLSERTMQSHNRSSIGASKDVLLSNSTGFGPAVAMFNAASMVSELQRMSL